jgi:uncharacterized protein YjbI with pentapeptide repeats
VVNSKENDQEAMMKSTARLRIGVLLILIVVGLVSSLVALLWGSQEWDGLALNLGSEMVGAIVTYLLLELFIGRSELKAHLIAQMGSKVQDVAIAAAEELRRHGWLCDGSLQGANLGGAKLQRAHLAWARLQRAYLEAAELQGADLFGAELQGAYLAVAKLQGADLSEANLQKAILTRTNLQGALLIRASSQEANLSDANLQKADLGSVNLFHADLARANLQRAYLGEANLQKVNLERADLRGADLWEANLQEANLSQDTTLPDGTNWTPDTDMARFTDPKHPDFWRPDAQ